MVGGCSSTTDGFWLGATGPLSGDARMVGPMTQADTEYIAAKTSTAIPGATHVRNRRWILRSTGASRVEQLRCPSRLVHQARRWSPMAKRVSIAMPFELIRHQWRWPPGMKNIIAAIIAMHRRGKTSALPPTVPLAIRAMTRISIGMQQTSIVRR